MIFSHRYHRALTAGQLAVELDDDFRRKLWAQLVKHNDPVGVRRDPTDRWIDNSTVLAEAAEELVTEHGWDGFPQAPGNVEDGANLGNIRHLVLTCEAEILFDLVELAQVWMMDATRAGFKAKLNGLFELKMCPWRLTDGEFFKLDIDFLGARLVDGAHQALTSHSFEGAANEFAQARQDAASGDAKDAILYAAKSFESLLKVLTGLDHANADHLIKALQAQGFLDDLPEAARSSFGEQVLKTLPALRNKLAGHGQGAAVVEVPTAYAELALQLAAAFHNFLIAKHLQRQPPAPPTLAPAPPSLEDEIPF